MDRDLLIHLPVVVAVARRRGFAAAAAELGMSPSAVSHAVRTVEDRVGQPLFARTTRSVSLTEAGDALIGTAEPALWDIADRIERIRSAAGGPSGLLRINTPRNSLALAMTRIVAEMAVRHPEVTVELFTDDALVDIVSQGFDAGVRLGEMIAEDMVAVRLTRPFRAIVVASPDYISRRGRPRSLGDLSAHNAIGYRQISSGAIYAWELADHGKDVKVETRGTVLVNDSIAARELALAGIGIAYLFEPLVHDDIESGRLVELLPKASIEEPGLFLYFPRRASMAPKLRAFIDVAKALAG